MTVKAVGINIVEPSVSAYFVLGRVPPVGVHDRARFCVSVTDQPTGFDLMADCALCGAMTEQSLVVARQMRHVACSNCGVVMRIDDGVLTRLREQAVAAQATIDRLS